LVKVIDMLSGERKEVDEKELITKTEKTNDFIISVSHSGTLIFSKFEKNLNIGKAFLLDTDLYTNKVFDESKGIIISSKIIPAQLNVNRFREGGDQLIPEHLRKDPLHHVLLMGESALKKEYEENKKQELLSYYDKYHDFLQKAIEKMKTEKGYTLLFDFHSLNSIGLSGTIDAGEERPDFDILTQIISAFEKTLREESVKHGLTVKSNIPYKGGAIIMKYSNPKQNIHALGIEIKRELLHVEGVEKNPYEFKPKPEGIKLVKEIISKAMNAASEAAEKL